MVISGRAWGLSTGLLASFACSSQGFLQNASFDVLHSDSLYLRASNDDCAIGVPESWVPGWSGFNGESVEFEYHNVAVSPLPEDSLNDDRKRDCPSLKDGSCIQLETGWDYTRSKWVETELLQPLRPGRRYRIGLDLQLIMSYQAALEMDVRLTDDISVDSVHARARSTMLDHLVDPVRPEHLGTPIISLGLSAKTQRILDEKMGPNDPLSIPRYMNHRDEIAFDFTTDFYVKTDTVVTGQWFHVEAVVEPTMTWTFLSLGGVKMLADVGLAIYYADNVTIEVMQ